MSSTLKSPLIKYGFYSAVFSLIFYLIKKMSYKSNRKMLKRKDISHLTHPKPEHLVIIINGFMGSSSGGKVRRKNKFFILFLNFFFFQ